MKAGVSKAPWRVVTRPRRASVFSSRTSNSNWSGAGFNAREASGRGDRRQAMFGLVPVAACPPVSGLAGKPPVARLSGTNLVSVAVLLAQAGTDAEHEL